jgi:DNA-binding response OmpR family regulator
VAHILLVEDDEQLSQQIKAWLAYDSHQVEIAADGSAGMAFLSDQRFDLVVLDWNLPDKSGLELCREFRAAGGQTPILMLSAKQAIDEKTSALDAGADDYLSKPFHPKELSARLNALLRRPNKLKPNMISLGGIDLDTTQHKALMGTTELAVSPREFALLQLLMENPNRVFTADEIVEKLWSAESEVSTSIVKVYVNKLRKRLADAQAALELRTARGAGYQLQLKQAPSD